MAALARRRIAVWCLEAAALDNVFPDACDVLDAAERAKAARFRFDRDRVLFLAAHRLLRHALSVEIPDVAPADWRFVRTPSGRPELAPEHGSDVRFSLTHGAGMTLVALARGREVGIDVEPDDDDASAATVVANALTADELERWSRLDGAAATRFAMARWTLKEAYTKARGLGLALDLRRIDFRGEKDSLSLRAPFPENEDAPQRFRFALFEPGASRVAALAVTATPSDSLTYQVLAPDPAGSRLLFGGSLRARPCGRG
jgi:4'-phosphopantetheinyl transferase